MVPIHGPYSFMMGVGYVIPAGWKVLPILGAVHVDASHHLEPEQFQPGRWEVYIYLSFVLHVYLLLRLV